MERRNDEEEKISSTNASIDDFEIPTTTANSSSQHRIRVCVLYLCDDKGYYRLSLEKHWKHQFFLSFYSLHKSTQHTAQFLDVFFCATLTTTTNRRYHRTKIGNYIFLTTHFSQLVIERPTAKKSNSNLSDSYWLGLEVQAFHTWTMMRTSLYGYVACDCVVRAATIHTTTERLVQFNHLSWTYSTLDV